MVGLSQSISLSFMIVGHTKFSPDSCFGLLNQKFRKTIVNKLQDIADVVTQSAVCNEVEVVGWEDGVSKIPTYDWQSYFAVHLNKVIGYQHFNFNNNNIGTVSCREVSDGPTLEI